MNRPITLVVMLAVLSGALAFLGTLLSAPSQLDEHQYGQQVRAAIMAGDWGLTGDISRRALRAKPRLQEAMLFLALHEDRMGSQRRADRLWARLELTSRENIRRGSTDPQELYYLGWGLSGQGQAQAARSAWRELVAKTPVRGDRYNRVCYLTLAGDTEGALAEWESLAGAPVGIDWGWARVDPDLEAIRNDPRFDAVIRRVRRAFQDAQDQIRI